MVSSVKFESADVWSRLVTNWILNVAIVFVGGIIANFTCHTTYIKYYTTDLYSHAIQAERSHRRKLTRAL